MLGVRHGQCRVLSHLFDRAEEEDLVPYDRAPNRPAELLAAEGHLVRIGLPGEVVLRTELPIALVDERRAVERVGPRLGHQRHRRAARAPVRRRELARGQLELFETLRRETHQRSAVVVVPVVGAVDGGDHVRAGGTHERHRPDVVLGPVEIGNRGGPGSSSSIPLIVRVIIGRF